MHNQPIDQDNSPHELDLRELDLRLTRALDTVPEIQIPHDFAARVASQVPARRRVSLKPTHYGDYALFLGVLITLAAMFLLGHTADHHTFGFVESILLAQFIVLTVWLSLRRHSLR